MWLKRIIVALIALAMLTPSIVIFPRYAYGNPYLDKLVTYDASRNVFVDKALTTDNFCMLGMAPMPTTGRLCREGIDRSAVLLVIPQTDIYSEPAAGSSSSAMRNPGGKAFKITNVDLANIAYAAADAMSAPESFVRGGLSYDARGAPADVFTDEAVRCDVLGWVLKISCRVLGVETKHDRKYAYQASERINEAMLRRTGKTLIAINDEFGREAVICALKRVGDGFLRS